MAKKPKDAEIKLQVEMNAGMAHRMTELLEEAVQKGAEEAAYQLIIREIGDVLKAEIKETVGAIVHEILKGEITPVNQWGEPNGDPLTVRAMLERNARQALSAKVDHEGKPPGRHSFQTITITEYVVRQTQNKIIAEALVKALKEKKENV